MLAELERRGAEVKGADLPEHDLADPMLSARLMAGKFGKLDWVVNCAAYTAVDKAESELDEAMKANALGPSYLGRACAIAQVRLLHVSTDFVFDGAKAEPYEEGDEPAPHGAYARSKHEGERAVRESGADAIIARTAWLYGPNGGSFPRTMIRAWKAGKPLRVVADQTGSPTYTGDLARVLTDLIEKNADAGIYHTAGPEAMTWHRFAGRAIEAYRKRHGDEGGPVEIEPIRTEDWPTPAPRPRYGVLSFKKVAALGIAPMRPVDEALAEFVERLGEAP